MYLYEGIDAGIIQAAKTQLGARFPSVKEDSDFLREVLERTFEKGDYRVAQAVLSFYALRLIGGSAALEMPAFESVRGTDWPVWFEVSDIRWQIMLIVFGGHWTVIRTDFLCLTGAQQPLDAVLDSLGVWGAPIEAQRAAVDEYRSPLGDYREVLEDAGLW